MTDPSIELISPCLGLGDASDMEVFGAVACLVMDARSDENLPLMRMCDVLMTPLRLGQYLLATEALGNGDSRAVGLAAWANLSPDAEARYLLNREAGLVERDWNSGDRMWVVEWLTPFGHGAMLQREMRRHLRFTAWRALNHRGGEHGGRRIVEFRGASVTREHANLWWSDRQPSIGSAAVSSTATWPPEPVRIAARSGKA